MNDEKPIPVRPLSGAARAWLHLRGTILVYRERYWAGETCVYIPVELVSFSEGKAFQGPWLIAALLSILFVPALGGAVYATCGLVAGPPSSSFVRDCVLTTALATVATFAILLARFLVRRNTMTIHVSPDAMDITLWMDPRREAELRRVAGEVKARQAVVAESIGFPMRDAVGDSIHRPWRRTAILTFVFIVPALMTGFRWLLLAGLIPPGLHALAMLREARQPREYREAVRHFHRREWKEALALIEVLLRDLPGHRPSQLLRIELRLRLDDFAGAESALAGIHDELDGETLQAIQRDIILRRRVWERMKEPVG